MSVVEAHDDRDADGRYLRGGALASCLVVIAAYLTAVYYIVNVVGDPTDLLVIVGVTLVVATVTARVISERIALAVAVGMLAVGMFVYLQTLPSEAFAWQAHSKYVIALLSGHSILEIVNVKLWVLAVTPGPVFLTWYLALRRRYAASALVGSATVVFFVLTGDATLQVALMGTVGALALVALGSLERAGGSLRGAEVVAIALAIVVIVSISVSVVPSGAALTYSPETGFVGAGGFGSGNTVEGNLLASSGSMQIQGSIELSPKVRFTVESQDAEYWRVDSYGLYTGEGWTRRSDATENLGRLSSPPGDARRLRQTFTAETETTVMPAAWRPVSVSGSDNVLATTGGSLVAGQPLSSGDRYTVVSERPVTTTDLLQSAGTDYPDRIQDRYTQLPDSTPDRVKQFTSQLTANADTPYETALTLEQWFPKQYDYSLDVPEPGDNVAAQFLFERDTGYCTYFATTMAVMLRTQGVPARMAVGYTPGERVGEDQWVVRGYDSHAWVEVYFEDVGWVKFDPTPAGGRQSAESNRLQEARANGAENVDTSGTRGGGYTPPTPSTPAGQEDPPWLNDTNGSSTNVTETTVTTASDPSTPTDAATPQRPQARNDGGEGPQLPSREELLLGLIAVVGLAVGARRSGVSSRLYRAAWLRYQPRQDPRQDVQRAYERVEYLVGRSTRSRRTGETVGQYVAAVADDERVVELARLYERARYAEDVTERDADRAVELADQVVADG